MRPAFAEPPPCPPRALRTPPPLIPATPRGEKQFAGRARLAAGACLRLLLAAAFPALLGPLAFGEPVRATVILAGQKFQLEIADTPELQSLGLGGRDALGKGRGMLFLYTQRGRHSFWMKGMRFPIDIIWLDNRRIVHVEHNVPPPRQGTPNASLPVYRSARPANAVLEIAAGIARELGLRNGDLVRFDFGGGSRKGG